MAQRRQYLQFLFVLFVNTFVLSECQRCNFANNRDMSPLDWVWPVAGPPNSSISFNISFCKPLSYDTSPQKENCKNSSVCMISGDHALSMGNYVSNSSEYAIFSNPAGSGFTLYLSTSSLCGNKGQMARSVISFSCGPTLGSPELTMYSECEVHFSWTTFAACAILTERKEVPCYVIDTEGNKRDLSFLINPYGGLFVQVPDPAMTFVINVCSDIKENKTTTCPYGSSACRRYDGQYVSLGSPSERLQQVEDGLLLTYKTNNSRAECILKPQTTILFRCPSRRGLIQGPKLISQTYCQYEVEWETEYACPQKRLTGDFKTCQFTMKDNGVEIDMSPLTKTNGGVYHVSGIAEGNKTDFYLNVCGGVGNLTCNSSSWKSIAICSNSSVEQSTIIGTTINSDLRYADGQIFLSFGKGSECSDGIQHTTLINFICNPNAANDGIGNPEHVYSDCYHFFKWETKYACVKKHAEENRCSVVNKNKLIDLQNLQKNIGDQAWEIVDRRKYQDRNRNESIYLNVCGTVSQLGDLSACDSEAAVCMMVDNKTVNLGSYMAPPFYDSWSNSVMLKYSNGSRCDKNRSYRSSIQFVCRPGHTNAAPVLKWDYQINCEYEFEWHTAEACPKGLIVGSDCQVYDSNLGINFDLTPLKSTLFEVDTKQYNFYVGICKDLPNTPCSQNVNSTKNVGICQVEKNSSNPKAWNIGESSSQLSYMDGILSLTYSSGDPYNNENRTSRTTVIAFICDYNAGIGKPHFVEEDEFVYKFHWYTSLVCLHTTSTECVVHDPLSNKQYDLTSLSKTYRNHISYHEEESGRKKVYINICRSLYPTLNCDSNAAACVVDVAGDTEKPYIPNIGLAIHRPEVVSNGQLRLTYTHGNSCVAYGQNISYTTVINFLCTRGGHELTGPRFLGKVGKCQYSYLWSTNAACPTVDTVVKDECRLTDPNTRFTFDLTSLRKEKAPYTVSNGSRTFQFNICGPVESGCSNGDHQTSLGNISACEINADGKVVSVLGAADSYTLRYYEGNYLSLSYINKTNAPTDYASEVIITFPCLNTTADPVPVFIKQENSRYFFEMKTPVTCQDSFFDCNFVDRNGNEYDLSPLARSGDKNWATIDSGTQSSNLSYYINFCQPLNPIGRCPGGSSAACRIDFRYPKREGSDLGSQYSTPIVNKDGTVIVRYTGGTFCPNGQFKSSTRVNLFCSRNQGSLIFIGETPECEYIFSLYTPAACPLQRSNGSNCAVKDPIFGYNFDLNPLKNTIANVTQGDYTYSLKVCDELHGFPKCIGSSVCQTKSTDPKFSKSLGRPNSDLVYNNGVITLKYEFGAGPCHGKHNRSSVITFTCDHDALGTKSGPTFISEAENCSYSFNWPTKYACPPFDIIECSAEDDQRQLYDLSKLSLSNDNYYVKNPMAQNQTFVINVCRSVVHTAESLCPYMSAACLLNSPDTTILERMQNLGQVVRSPYFENGKLKIKYTSGDTCILGDENGVQFMETDIEFVCDKQRINSEPEFLGKDGCTYYFMWTSAYACPLQVVEATDNCTAYDSLTGHQYNLTSLTRDAPYEVLSGDHQFNLNICGTLKNSSCGPESGVCQEEIIGSKRHWNAGKSNSKLYFDDGILFLNYSGGDSCHKGLFERNTIVEFQCGKGLGSPTFLYETGDCTYRFNWATELACQSLVHCAIKNGSDYFNLAPLADADYYTAESSLSNDDANYLISVCHPLRHIPGTGCPPGSSICRVSNNGATVESLGRIEIHPFIDFEGHATAIYTNGSTCLSNPQQQNRAKIMFFCDSDELLGEPVLTESDDCLYTFEWRTSIVCPENNSSVSPPEASCIYSDLSKGINFDLTTLRKAGSYYEVKEENETSAYLLNVCGTVNSSNLEKCTGSGICFQKGNKVENYGMAATQRFTYDGRRLIYSLFNGDDCPFGTDGKRTSEIFFVCDPAAGIGTPRLYKEYTCLAVFMWETDLVCRNIQHQCNFDIEGNHYDFHLLSSMSHNWNTTDSKGNIYWLNLCRGIRQNKETAGCPPSSAVCMKDNSGSHMPLGLIYSAKIKQTNSSGLELTYNSGTSQPCLSVAVNSSVAVNATTRIFLTCGSSLGTPKLLSGPDSSCFFDFAWETSLACAEKTGEVLIEKDEILYDKRFQYGMNLKNILNKTYGISAKSDVDGVEYIYFINLGGVNQNGTNLNDACSVAAVCQTKPQPSSFKRDVGSFSTRKFFLIGTELHLVLTSLGSHCGKNKARNVTTRLNMQCSKSAGFGTPTFLYESGGCDYVFNWDTNAVCPDFSRPEEGKNATSSPSNERDHHGESAQSSTHRTAIVLCVIALMCIVCGIIFVVSKAERRAAVSSKFRGLFCRVNLPHFRYKRANGERLILIDDAPTFKNYADTDVDMLTL